MNAATGIRPLYRWIVLGLFLAVVGSYGWHFFSKSRKTDALLKEAESAIAAREYGKARDSLDRYLTERPDDHTARLLAARATRETKAYAEAREHLRKLREIGGDAERIAIEESLIDLQTGDESGIESLRARAAQDDELALTILEVLIQRDLDTYQLGPALDGFTRYLSLRPDDLHARLGRAYVWERFLNFADALEDYRHAAAKYPDNERVRMKLADTLLVVGTPEEALTHYQWLHERWPERPPVRLGLARCYRRLAQPEESAKILDGLIKEFPNHAETLWERGELELDRGRPDAAEPMLRKAAALRPFDRRVHYALYRCLLRLDRKADAEAVDAKVKQLDADLARIREVRNAVLERPNDADLRSEGGLLFLRNGEREEGLRWLQLALRIDPACEKARRALLIEASRPPEREKSPRK